MKNRVCWLLSLVVASFVPATALAQSEGDDPSKEGEPVELGDEGDPFGSSDVPGADENPEAAPDSPFGDKGDYNKAKTKVESPPTEYPIEEVKRPITLPRFMTEVTLDYPAHSFDPIAVGGLLSGSFGISHTMQAGLAYGVGTITEDGYEVGKAVALDFTYLILDWLGAQVTVPILLDPFALGVTLAAPMKFTFLDKVSIIVGEEFFTVKLAKFTPIVENAAATEALVALDSTDTQLNDWDIRPGIRVQYQLKPNLALEGRARITQFHPDNDTTQSDPFLFTGGVLYSRSNKLDFGGRLGWSDLASLSDTFGVSVFASLRI